MLLVKNGFLTEEGWKHAHQLARFQFSEEQRMIGHLLKEIIRRDIIIQQDIDPVLAKKILTPEKE